MTGKEQGCHLLSTSSLGLADAVCLKTTKKQNFPSSISYPSAPLPTEARLCTVGYSTLHFKDIWAKSLPPTGRSVKGTISYTRIFSKLRKICFKS